MDVRKESSKAGGCPAPVPLTDLEFKVVSLIPQCQIEGITGGLESEVDEIFQTLNMVSESGLPTEEYFDSAFTSDERKSNETPGPISMYGTINGDEATSMAEPVETAEDQPSHNSASNDKDLKLNRCRQRKSENPKHQPEYVASIMEMETTKADALKELIEVQKRMLKISEDHLTLERERLDLEKSKFQLLQHMLINPGNKSPNTLSPVIQFMYSS
ncbi:uncharacterized protein LOC124290047 isoform X1 [Haliotis rubra]|uniref:uncharacterized protein LOC124290047 isoform X1 n=1 Tax=Haliotis rubra TaxID=36100 RepID=UPI001EE508C5|nr:uncharacterized protein LOC124290047 isoform X1 [Haliotis rubra]